MSVTLTYSCGGCNAKADGVRPMRREFRSFSGMTYGFGVATWADTPETLAPKGWMASDPWTYCTYCPECWRSIVEKDEATA